MIHVSEMTSFLAAFASLHEQADRPISPFHAGTIASLLRLCADEAAGMEIKLYAKAEPANAENENVIRVNFNRNAPPSDGGDAA